MGVSAYITEHKKFFDIVMQLEQLNDDEIHCLKTFVDAEDTRRKNK